MTAVPSTRVPGTLEATLRASRDAGRKLLVPYLTGGLDDEWLLVLEALAGAGADAIEVGIPFSDPMIDGAVIQESSLRALQRGSTPEGVLADLSRVDVGVPLVVMTYYNLIYRAGHERIAGTLEKETARGSRHVAKEAAQGSRRYGKRKTSAEKSSSSWPGRAIALIRSYSRLGSSPPVAFPGPVLSGSIGSMSSNPSWRP